MDKQEQKLWRKIYLRWVMSQGSSSAKISADNAILQFRKSKMEYGQ